MPRLLKIALMTAMAFLGGLLASFGVRLWFTTHRTTLTKFDTVFNSDPNALPMDTSDPWIDKGFVMHRVLAVMILLLGIGILGLAARQIFKKSDESAA